MTAQPMIEVTSFGVSFGTLSTNSALATVCSDQVKMPA